MKVFRRWLTSVRVKCVPLDTSGIQLWKKSFPFLPFKDTHINIPQGFAQCLFSQFSHGSKCLLEASCWSSQICLPCSCWENIFDKIPYCMNSTPATLTVIVWKTRGSLLKVVYFLLDFLPTTKFSDLLW